MHRIDRLHITGFKRLREIDIEMRPLIILIGANGVGKTSFLEAISLLSASANGNLNTKLSDLGGIFGISTIGQAPEMMLSVSTTFPDQNLMHYLLKIEGNKNGFGYNIPEEKLTQGPKEIPDSFFYINSKNQNISYWNQLTNQYIQPNWQYNYLESALSQVPKMFELSEVFRQTINSKAHYHVLNVGQYAPVKSPQQMKPAYFPGENGEELFSFLYTMKESFKDKYDLIEDTLRAAFPWFESLNFPPIATGMFSMFWKEKQFKNPIHPYYLSEGTLRFLWLISLLHSPNLPAITMIDEPEVSLHPEMFPLLVDTMREASARTQLIVATHSDRLVRFLEPQEVFVMDIGEDGYSTGQWADSFDLERWLRDYTLDEVWRMGRIGGRA